VGGVELLLHGPLPLHQHVQRLETQGTLLQRLGTQRDESGKREDDRLEIHTEGRKEEGGTGGIVKSHQRTERQRREKIAKTLAGETWRSSRSRHALYAKITMVGREKRVGGESYRLLCLAVVQCGLSFELP
jgi:hypothetical protein